MSHDPRADKTHRNKASSSLKNSQLKNLKNVQNNISPQCARVQARLLPYLDGSLSERERTGLQQHLERCEKCRQELALYQESEQALSNALHAVPPAGDLRPAFYARLASEPAPRSSRLPRLNWRLAVPALAACGLLAGWLTVPHQQSAAPIIARIDQDTRVARIDKNTDRNEAKSGSAADTPIDAPHEAQTIQPASPALTPERFAHNPVTQLSGADGNGVGNEACQAEYRSACQNKTQTRCPAHCRHRASRGKGFASCVYEIACACKHSPRGIGTRLCQQR